MISRDQEAGGEAETGALHQKGSFYIFYIYEGCFSSPRCRYHREASPYLRVTFLCPSPFTFFLFFYFSFSEMKWPRIKRNQRKSEPMRRYRYMYILIYISNDDGSEKHRTKLESFAFQNTHPYTPLFIRPRVPLLLLLNFILIFFFFLFSISLPSLLPPTSPG